MDTLKNELLALFQRLKGILNGSPWENEYAKTIDEMSSELDNPCVLAVAGMMKTGKSSFINAFLRGDYAAVRDEETTATINYFCYDKNLKNVPDKQKPILCVKVDGSKEWVTKSYLDSLQGNSEDILNKSMEINYLEYFL
ncbi:MAG: dynamin family protein, partial [Thermoguttaceae bacterium]|nr:dynamin family protein [Thermoguttaceae bacterium]